MKLRIPISSVLILATIGPAFSGENFDRSPLVEVIPGLLWSGNHLFPGDPKLRENDYYDLKSVYLHPELPLTCEELIETDIYNVDYAAAPLVSTEWARLASIQGACWIAMRYDHSIVPEQNFLGEFPLSKENMHELWNWLVMMNQTHDTDDYTKFVLSPVIETYKCVSKEECYSFDYTGSPGSTDLRELSSKNWVAYYDLWAVTDVNHDGFADALFSAYDRVHGRLKPDQHIIITRKGAGKALEVLEIFPPWPENWYGVILPTKFYE